MERRVTIRDIARALGCHHSTVSLALRDDARLPQETRRRVQEAAEKMGYRPDPMVQALAFYRTAVKPATDHGKLAWLSNEREPQFGPNYSFRRYADGAEERAAKLGYRLEEFVLRSPGMTPRRMVQILQTRGITGIIVAPQPTLRIRARIRMDWSPFSAVSIGYSLAWPPLHMVTNHQFNTAKMAYRKLISLGCRRIGICIYRVVNERCNGGFLGGYFSESLRRPSVMHVPPYVYNRRDTKEMKAWFLENRPEAVIVHDSRDIEWMEQELKLRIPEDVCMVCLGETSKGYAHISQNSHEVGAAAVDLLVSMIQRNERGIPEIPHRLLIEGTWHDGHTVRRVNVPEISE
jgi:LacI family transcriptional regulator